MAHNAQNWIGAKHICIKHSDGTILADDVELTLGSGFAVGTVNAVNSALDSISSENALAKQWNGQTNKNTWKAEVSGLSQYLTGPWLAQKLSSYNTALYIYNKNFPEYKIRFFRPSKVYGDQDYFPKAKIQCMVGDTVVWDTSNKWILDGYENGQHYWSTWAFFLDPATMEFYPFWSGGWDATNRWYTDGYILRYNAYANLIFNTVFRDVIPQGGGGAVYPSDDFTNPIGGNGDYDDTSDTVENPALPVITANASGFVTAFVPTIGEINALANYMISPSFLQALGQSTLLGGFKDMLLGLQVFPCTIPAGTAEQLWLYYPGVAISSGVLMGKATNQFVEIDCGDLEVEEYWGNCCDYNPYTKIGIFLPFCGFYDLDTDDVMGKTLNVSYRIDIMSGACLATIKVDGSVMYQYSGTCSAQIPLNSTSYDELFKSMIELGTATATGGAGLLAAGASYNTALERSVNMSDKNSYMANAMMDEADAHYDMAKVNAASSLANSTVSNIIGSKAIYKHAGALGSSVGFLGVRKPYLIIKRPYQQIPDMYGKFHGYPCFTKANLSDLTGYTVVDDIRLNIPDATVDEILECEKLLKEGVVL